jgi:predicted molibdopterin-dependent oxidoreductase YjgC
VVRDVARAAGLPWTCESPGDVMDEIAAVAPALFGGVTYDRLEHDGLQWPCPTTTHPGMATVHADGFVRGRGRLTCADYVPAPEQQDGGHPYLLITGRVLHQYNVGTMTRRTPQQSLSPADVLHIHPDDAGSLGIGDDGRVRVASHWGATEVPARLDARMAPGTVFLSFHHPATKTNALVGPHVDPRSDCPDYKVTAVRLEAV